MSADARTARPARTSRPTRPAALSAVQGTRLVAAREISMRLRSKAFLISTGILLVVVLGSIVASGIFAANAGAPKVAVVPQTAPLVSGLDDRLDITQAATVADAEQLVRDGDVEAAIVLPGTVEGATPAPTATGTTGTPGGPEAAYEVLALSDTPTSVVSLLSLAPPVQLLEPGDSDGFLAYVVGIAFGIVFFMAAVTFGSTIAQSVVEEKQTRVVEILLSTINARELLAGKVIGNSVLAFGQTALIGLAAVLGLAITGQSGLLGLLGPAIAWFVVFFVFGFVLIAAMYSASAALVSRQEDVGSVTSPVTTLVMLPYFLVIFFNSNEAVMAVMSYVPFSAPIGMPLRLFLGDAEWWEPLVSLVILLATTAVVVVIGSRIYANSLLRTGPRVKLADALKG
ncbi:ABC transporter permease [Herbiconiux flava]|uniref:ABC-2 type transport system permease protein n=1 Tax=Herbiconiux flava TaxID=881268 RepID=A0A852SAW0_9MICO|nr:ABC transporter permease [Herbiconiux flava]NYD69506.1 ABC-2 type transport system permease protein [Herbiconiux flava]GLK16251.1 ABC transporter permease [Herbiconiux flava]